MTKEKLIKKISNLLDKEEMIFIRYPFVPDHAGDQEEIVGIKKDFDNKVHILTWNNDNGGDREDDLYNEDYLIGELFTKGDLEELYSQINEICYISEERRNKKKMKAIKNWFLLLLAAIMLWVLFWGPSFICK